MYLEVVSYYQKRACKLLSIEPPKQQPKCHLSNLVSSRLAQLNPIKWMSHTKLGVDKEFNTWLQNNANQDHSSFITEIYQKNEQ